jgi:hypothetical protein
MMIHETKHDLILPCDLFLSLLVHGKSKPGVEDFTSRIDFKSIVLYLKAKGMNDRAIHNAPIAMIDMKMHGYSIVMGWFRETQLDQFFETAVDFTEDVEVDEIDEPILSALELQPFGSVRHIAQLTPLIHFTVNW